MGRLGVWLMRDPLLTDSKWFQGNFISVLDSHERQWINKLGKYKYKYILGVCQTSGQTNRMEAANQFIQFFSLHSRRTISTWERVETAESRILSIEPRKLRHSRRFPPTLDGFKYRTTNEAHQNAFFFLFNDKLFLFSTQLTIYFDSPSRIRWVYEFLLSHHG